MKMYTSKSNAKRAAKKTIGSNSVEGGDYSILEQNGKFGFISSQIHGETPPPVADIMGHIATKETKQESSSKSKSQTDQFGFRKGTLNNLFGKMVARNGGCTMKQARNATWNKNNISFYNPFRALVEKGLAERNKNGQMVVATA